MSGFAQADRPSGQRLGTVASAIEVLGAFTDAMPERGVTDLAQELGMDKSKVHRLLSSLAAGGLLVSVPRSRRYVLGPTLVLLGERAARQGVLPRAAQPIVDELARAARESVVVCVMDRLGYRTVASADGPSDLRFATELGRWFPGSAGANGHLLFAHHPDPGIAERLVADQDQDQASVLDAATLRTRHAAAREDGYSISRGEFDPRVMAISAPVLLDGAVIASLGVVGPPPALDHHVDDLLALVRAAAADLSGVLSRPAPHDLDPIGRS
ncbi:MAG: IclR family transcriptional regulator [Propioniciclava sp.]|uniref:IclR family transcriptional regulator n=1 Tax=Propioniciclava sp. TaxID=2038686 RepID=UPI0039E52D3A